MADVPPEKEDKQTPPAGTRINSDHRRLIAQKLHQAVVQFPNDKFYKLF